MLLDKQNYNLKRQSFREMLYQEGIEFSPKSLKIIRDEVLNAFDKNTPLSFKHSTNYLGDHFIFRSALSIPLIKFLKREGLVDEEASYEQLNEILPQYLSLAHSKSNGLNIKQLFAKWGRADQLYEFCINNLYVAYLFWMADHLDVELTEDDINTPPLPFTCDFEISPMQSYDFQKVLEYKTQFMKIMEPDVKYCVILHGGRLPSKRFSRKQVRSAKQTLKLIFPRSKYCILTAQEIDKNGDPMLTEADAEIVISATEDINKTIALFLAPSDITYIPTDTFLGWVGGGSIALRSDRNGKLNPKDVYVMNTIASAQFWKIPGANHCESFVIEYLRKTQGLMSSSTDHIIYPETYYNHHEYKSFSGIKPEHIADEDFIKFLSFIVEANYDHNLET